MKKYILFLFIFCLQLVPTKAQWVTIPDANFATKLQQLFPSCMNGNLMDTTCSLIVNTTILNVSNANISDLTGIEYFVNLTHLYCANNQLTSLPALPDSLTLLECYLNPLTSLPSLPNSLISLQCYFNQLTSLPALPNTLTQLHCYNNLLSGLPALPNSLTELWCMNNQLASLPTLPNSLIDLYCYYNQLTILPALSNSLINLLCYNNQLTSLPALPNSLIDLDCQDNQLISLPALQGSLLWLDCSNNQLTHMPPCPDQMQKFKISGNNISCLFNLPEILNGNGNNPAYANISNNQFTCVPNQTVYSGALPLCFYSDSINNPNNCWSVNIIGKVFQDVNGNCALNNIDILSDNIPVKLYNSQNVLVDQTYTLNGVYSFGNLMSDNYSVRIDTLILPITMDCGQSNVQILALSSANQTIQNVNFSVQCNTPYDVWVQSLTASGWVFPGQIHTLNTNISSNGVWYNLDCGASNFSGNVSINVTGPVTYISPANNALTPTVNGNTFTYNITDFSNLTPQSFGLKFLTDTSTQTGDQICLHVEINPTPLDADTTNNVYDFCYQVVNSYDPNMKEVYPVNVLPGYYDWFTYTIHFQNTGNAPAFNIRLRDTLDANLDINTFEIRGYSHPAIVSINGNNLTVRFNDIMLHDSTTDYDGSMGYFQYRIKPLPNLPLGTQIENTAYIYFDYNAPIVTNTTQNNFQTVVSTINRNDDTNQLKVFPNPANETLNINLQNNMIENCIITNALGQTVFNSANEMNANHKIQLNISNLIAGLYFVKVRASNGSYNAKFIKAE